jgi:hydrogenase maturation factor
MVGFNPVKDSEGLFVKFVWALKQLETYIIIFGILLTMLTAFGVIPVPVIGGSSYLKAFVLIGIPVGLVSFPVARWLIKNLWTPPYRILLEIKGDGLDNDSDRVARINWIGEDKFREMELDGGDRLRSFQTNLGVLGHVVKEYDHEENRAEANWMSKVTEAEMVSQQNKIEQARVETSKLAKWALRHVGAFDMMLDKQAAKHTVDVEKMRSEIESSNPEKFDELLEEIYGETMEEDLQKAEEENEGGGSGE